MIRPNVTFTVRTENSEITTVSRDVPKVSHKSTMIHDGAITVLALQHNRRAVVLYL